MTILRTLLLRIVPHKMHMWYHCHVCWRLKAHGMREMTVKPDDSALKVGDIILLHGNSVVSRIIRLAIHSHWNHAAMIAGSFRGTLLLIEATFEGVRLIPTTWYSDDEWLVIRSSLPGRTSAVRRAMSRLGARYDFVNYPRLLLKGLRAWMPWLPYRVRLQKNNLYYCFELVGYAYDRPWMLPQDILRAAPGGDFQPLERRGETWKR